MGMRSRRNKIRVWSIRLKDGRPIIFDEETQCPPGKPPIELHFLDKEYAEILLEELKDRANTQFEKDNMILVEHWISKEQVCLQMTAEDVHEKALEERRRGDTRA